MTHVTGNKSWLKKGDVLFVSLRRDSNIPFFVSHIKSATKEEIILHLEDTDSVEAAKKLVGREVMVKDDVLVNVGATDSPLLWIGFEVQDANHGLIGVIGDVFQTPTQWLAEVQHKGKEVLIPLIEPMLKSVDVAKKVVKVELPEGLLEVYL